MKKICLLLLGLVTAAVAAAVPIAGEIAHYPMREGKGEKIFEAQKRLPAGKIRKSFWTLRDNLSLVDFGGMKSSVEASVELPEINFDGDFTIAVWVNAFSELMNRRADELGMRNSRFLNPHGLNEAGHCSTARDLAILMHTAMKNNCFSELISRDKAVIGGQTIYNHNKLLQRYSGCIGGKTGYTKVAGRCLVSCCERDDLRLVCVTLNDPDDWNDHAKLYDWAYENFTMLVINVDNTRFDVPLFGGGDGKAAAVPSTEQRLLLHTDCEPTIQTTLPFYVFAPVSGGAEAGSMRVLLDDRLLCEIPLIFSDDYPVR